MIQFHILDVIILFFLLAFIIGFTFLVMAIWKKNSRYYQIGGISLIIGIFAFFTIPFIPGYEDIEEVIGVEPYVSTLSSRHSNREMTPESFIAALETEGLSEYGTFSYDDELEVLVFTIDANDDMYSIVRLAKAGDTEDYEQLKIWFENISISLWDELGVPLSIRHTEADNETLLLFKNGDELFDFLNF